MASLIPLLEDLYYRKNRFGVPTTVALSFVKIHSTAGSADDAYRTAQEHWERIVKQVLNSDAVAHDAHGQDAMDQAVTATVEALRAIGNLACPICRILALAVRSPDDEKSG